MNPLDQGGTSQVEELSPRELSERMIRGEPFALLDVREPFERQWCAITAAEGVMDLHVPMNQIPSALDEIQRRREGLPLVVYCHHGVRSNHVALWLAERGFDRLANLAGGIDAWSLDVDPGVRRY